MRVESETARDIANQNVRESDAAGITLSGRIGSFTLSASQVLGYLVRTKIGSPVPQPSSLASRMLSLGKCALAANRYYYSVLGRTWGHVILECWLLDSLDGAGRSMGH